MCVRCTFNGLNTHALSAIIVFSVFSVCVDIALTVFLLFENIFFFSHKSFKWPTFCGFCHKRAYLTCGCSESWASLQRETFAWFSTQTKHTHSHSQPALSCVCTFEESKRTTLKAFHVAWHIYIFSCSCSKYLVKLLIIKCMRAICCGTHDCTLPLNDCLLFSEINIKLSTQLIAQDLSLSWWFLWNHFYYFNRREIQCCAKVVPRVVDGSEP